MTVEALAKHDETQLGKSQPDRMSDGISVGSHGTKTVDTFNTFASNWTECTNATFGRVHRHWGANATEFHKEVHT